jgi:hypothetical protein
MIIKTMDSKQGEIEQLSSLLNERITPNQQFQIERELRAIRSGVIGEKDAAYYIHFYFGESKNWAVIHDLRIEHESQVAQIDHILMNRMFDIYVLESKNYSYKIAITPEGDFKVNSGRQYYGIPSPIEQNKRHIHLLERFFKAKEILPKRMGMSISPRLKSLIMMSPKSIIARPTEKKLDTSMVIKADTLRTKIDDEAEKIGPAEAIAAITQMSSSSTLEEVARRLVRYHRPHTIDWRERFGLAAENPPDFGNVAVQKNRGLGIKDSSKYFCFKCKKGISQNVAKFCFQNRPKFGGKAYCYECQKSF